MKIKQFLSISLLLGLSLMFLPVHAQGDDATTPIFFSMSGDIWSYTLGTGQLKQESTWGYNEPPRLSPAGTHFAYLSLAQVGVDVLSQTNFLFDPQPKNVWLWEIATGDAVRITEQPANATPNLNGYVENAIRRDALTWSPDGTQLAWIELGSEFGFALMIYDLASQSSRLLTTELPFPYADAGMTGIHRMVWLEGGIVVETAGVADSPNGFGIQDSLSVYDVTTGALLRRDTVGTDTGFVYDMFAVDAQTVGLAYWNGGRALYRIQTGALEGSIDFEVVSPYSGDGKVRLGVTDTSGIGQNWEINWAGLPPLFFSTHIIHERVAFSPSGSALAYITDSLYISQGGTPQKIAGTEGLAENAVPTGVIWGQQRWQSIPTEGCPLQPRLVIGQQAAVIPDLGNNILRDRAGKNADGSNEIGRIPPNGIVRVLGGPQCVSGYNWWQVDYNGQIGWTAEGEGGIYWLTPNISN